MSISEYTGGGRSSGRGYARECSGEFRGAPYYREIEELAHMGVRTRRERDHRRMDYGVSLEAECRYTGRRIREFVSERDIEQSHGRRLIDRGRWMLDKLAHESERMRGRSMDYMIYDEASSTTGGTMTLHSPKPKKKPKTARELLQKQINKWLKGVELPEAA